MTAATLTVPAHLFHSANETGVEHQSVLRWLVVSCLLYTIQSAVLYSNQESGGVRHPRFLRWVPL